MLEDEVERRVVVDWDVLHACKSAVRDCGMKEMEATTHLGVLWTNWWPTSQST